MKQEEDTKQCDLGCYGSPSIRLVDEFCASCEYKEDCLALALTRNESLEKIKRGLKK